MWLEKTTSQGVIEMDAYYYPHFVDEKIETQAKWFALNLR